MAEGPRRSRRLRPRCANCDVLLKGPWCHACGQHAEGLERTVRQVLLEWAQGLVHFDRRARATLPDLILRPARLTRAYLEGRRAPQIPPLRMFLVVVVLAFGAGAFADWTRAERHGRPIFLYVGETPATGLGGPGVAYDKMTATQRTEAHGAIRRIDLGWAPASRWLQARLDQVVDKPKALAEAWRKWSQRLVLLLLPIACGLLCLIFVRRREVLVFDHLVFAMHSLSFQGLLLAATELVAIAPAVPAVGLTLAGPVHLFVHMRGVYRTSVAGTLARMTVLGVGSLVAFAVLLLATVFASLAAMKPGD